MSRFILPLCILFTGLCLGNLYGYQMARMAYEPLVTRSIANTDACLVQAKRAIAIIRKLEHE